MMENQLRLGKSARKNCCFGCGRIATFFWRSSVSAISGGCEDCKSDFSTIYGDIEMISQEVVVAFQVLIE